MCEHDSIRVGYDAAVGGVDDRAGVTVSGLK